MSSRLYFILSSCICKIQVGIDTSSYPVDQTFKYKCPEHINSPRIFSNSIYKSMPHSLPQVISATTPESDTIRSEDISKYDSSYSTDAK